MGLIRDLQALMFRANQERPVQALGAYSGAGLAVGGAMAGAIGGQSGILSALTMSSWLFAVVDRIVTSVAATPWHVFTGEGESRRENPRHWAAQLWERPNPFSTRLEFAETTLQHYELVGEMWWVIVRDSRNRPVELWPVRPDRMQIVPHPTEHIAGYVYRIGSQAVPLGLEDVVFIRRANPLDPYRGMGVVQALFVDIGSEREAATWNRTFFRNSAMPGGIIELDEHMDDQQWERFVSRWREQHQGTANAHRVAVLERGHWVDSKFSMRDMQFEQMRRLNRDIILGAFGVHGAILGLSESVNRANAEAATEQFARWVMLPLLRRLQDALNSYIAPLWTDNLAFEFEDPVPENRELDLLKAVEGYKAGFLSQNEARQFLGLDDVEGGESFYVPLVFGAAPSEASGLRLRDASQSLRERAMAEMEERWNARLGREGRRIAAFVEQELGGE